MKDIFTSIIYQIASENQQLNMRICTGLKAVLNDKNRSKTIFSRTDQYSVATIFSLLTKTNILVCGVKGTVAEFCKNIVLAGVGSVTLVDNRTVTEDSLSANFLIPPDESIYKGKTLAELCCDSLKEFNPMVRVSAVKGDVLSFDTDFYSKFDVVVVSCCPLSTKKLINEKCRKLTRRVSFYAVDCRDSCGEIFVDLQDYKYTKKFKEEAVACELKYPSFEEAISTPWAKLPNKVSNLYFAMRVIEKFEEAEGRHAGEISTSDLPNVLKIKKDLCKAQSIDESRVPDDLLERLVYGPREFPPVCAILGGFLGQEVIKAISGKGDPIKNFFFFDVVVGKGVIEDISGPDSGSNVRSRAASLGKAQVNDILDSDEDTEILDS